MLLMIDNYDLVLLKANHITETYKITAESIDNVPLSSISDY